jgi:hypothetical protein
MAVVSLFFSYRNSGITKLVFLGIYLNAGVAWQPEPNLLKYIVPFKGCFDVIY